MQSQGESAGSCSLLSLMESVDAYEAALSPVLSQEKAVAPAVLLKALVARDLVAQQLKDARLPYEHVLDQLVRLDAGLKSRSRMLLRSITGKTLRSWRASLEPEDVGWWWSLDDDPSAYRWYDSLPIALAWIVVALSLTVVVETLRSLLAGADDGISTATQALLAVLVGSTAIQYSRRLLGADGKGEPSGSSHAVGRQYGLAIALVLGASLLEWQRPSLALWFSNRGTAYKIPQRAQALRDYQRAAELNADDGFAHVNLASFYEEVFDYDKAESEYVAAIRSSPGIPHAYEKLGRLQILRRKDYANALRLFEAGLHAADNLRRAPPPDIDLDHSRYRLLVARAWARFGLSAYVFASMYFKEATALEAVGASAYCLLAQVQEKQNALEATREAKKTCIELASIDVHKDEIEPDWLSLAKEPIANVKQPKKGSGR